MSTLQHTLFHALEENHLVIDEAKQAKLVRYLELMQDWNRVFNLTTITDAREMVYLHLIDSLIIQPFLQGTRLLDVGSGAGLPGLPLAILNPEQHWVLLDKNSKKTRFLTQTVAELKLSHVSVVHSRSEDYHPKQCFDSILSRAFGTVRLFTETTEALLCDNGIFLAMKGKYPQQELDELPSRFVVQNVTRLEVKGTKIERHIVSLKRQH
jgi:16S rRNA (guanine527-N7)-methyltransferase